MAASKFDILLAFSFILAIVGAVSTATLYFTRNWQLAMGLFLCSALFVGPAWVILAWILLRRYGKRARWVLIGSPFALSCTAVAFYTVIGLFWLFMPDHQCVTNPESRLILESDEVNRLISQQANSPEEAALIQFQKQAFGKGDAAHARWRDLYEHPERYIPERLKFLDAMARAPRITVPAKSYCRILQNSHAICSKYPSSNPEYVKVVITSGPLKGQVGWGCFGDGIGYSMVLP